MMIVYYYFVLLLLFFGCGFGMNQWWGIYIYFYVLGNLLLALLMISFLLYYVGLVCLFDLLPTFLLLIYKFEFLFIIKITYVPNNINKTFNKSLIIYHHVSLIIKLIYLYIYLFFICIYNNSKLYI